VKLNSGGPEVLAVFCLRLLVTLAARALKIACIGRPSRRLASKALRPDVAGETDDAKRQKLSEAAIAREELKTVLPFSLQMQHVVAVAPTSAVSHRLPRPRHFCGRTVARISKCISQPVGEGGADTIENAIAYVRTVIGNGTTAQAVATR
jgi:hypothetical protein